jgi:tRNA threonylcarbamoyladenosine biosynthesis protein TsaE
VPLFISHSVEETEAFGERIGRAAKSGWVLGLRGDLGVGKTALVRGIARGLGATARVLSPSYSLINIYRGGRLTLYHLDLYRLQGPLAVHEAGLDEYINDPDGFSVVEWLERSVSPSEAEPRLRWAQLRITAETEREIQYDDFGD